MPPWMSGAIGGQIVIVEAGTRAALGQRGRRSDPSLYQSAVCAGRDLRR